MGKNSYTLVVDYKVFYVHLSSRHLAVYLFHWVSSVSPVSLLVHVLRIGWCSRLFCALLLRVLLWPQSGQADGYQQWSLWGPDESSAALRAAESHCAVAAWTEASSSRSEHFPPLLWALCPFWAQQAPLEAKEQVSTTCYLGPLSVYETLAGLFVCLFVFSFGCAGS